HGGRQHLFRHHPEHLGLQPYPGALYPLEPFYPDKKGFGPPVAASGRGVLRGMHANMADIEDSAATVVTRRVLLTGGTSGLGLAMASALAHAGASVVLTGRDQARAEEVAATL